MTNDTPRIEPDARIANAISEIENVLKITHALVPSSLPREVELVIGHQLAHFFNLGQLVSHELIIDMRNELARMDAKIDMLMTDLKHEAAMNAQLRLEVAALRGTKY